MLVCVLVILISPVAFLYWRFQVYFPNPWTRQLEFAGKVIDAQSRDGVPNVRVVIIINNEFGLTGYEQHFYGLTTDQYGEFRIKTESPIDVDWVSVDACSREGKSASVVKESDSTVLEIDYLSKELPSYRQLTNFTNFTGRYYPFSPTKMEFVGVSWEIDSP